MAEDMNNNDNEQSEGMPDDLRRLLARAEQGEDGDPDSYNPDAEDEEEDDDAELLDAETAKADVNPLERMWNMLVQMVRAIIEIFKNR